jgi:hypothetical protein
MRDAQVGQLDPSRVSIAADPDGGKLIDGPIAAIVRYMRRFDLDMRSGQIQRSKIQSEPLALQTVLPESERSSSSDLRAIRDFYGLFNLI